MYIRSESLTVTSFHYLFLHYKLYTEKKETEKGKMHKMGFELQTIAYQSRVVTRVLKRPRYESTLTARVRLLHSYTLHIRIKHIPVCTKRECHTEKCSPCTELSTVTSTNYYAELTCLKNEIK